MIALGCSILSCGMFTIPCLLPCMLLCVLVCSAGAALLVDVLLQVLLIAFGCIVVLLPSC